ncbi:MAG: DNA polymerase III subunit gamma/tau [Eubacterium sp.]|nr:DNA polymerase III subunit gamma/tau [Eubacterium sp.]
MNYVALYRKFRPATFEEVRGQEHIVTTLKNQLRAGRIGHAYLFCGTRGTGKTTVAKILARAVNCEHPADDGSPCNTCASCRDILAGTSTNVLEIDAASNNGVDNIREIREEVVYRPTRGRYKVYIIDEAHMLSPGAWNALLKTLEEPPEYVIFILATTEVAKIPVTILSRCQRYNFRRITSATIASRMQELLREEQVEAEETAVRYIARAADGSMRDALSLLDQCIAFYLGEKLTYGKVLDVLGRVDTDLFSSLLRRIIVGDVSGTIHAFQDVVRAGSEVGQFVSEFTWYLRNLLLVQSSEDLEDTLDISAENLQQLKEESAMVSTEVLMRYIRVLSELSGQLRFATGKQILVETALIRLCRPQTDPDLSGILDRLRVLEKKMEEGSFVPAGAGVQSVPVQRMENASEGIKEKESAAAVKKAAPEDLKLITAHWRQIVGQTEYRMRAVLSMIGPPRYDSSTGEAKLYLETSDPISLNLLKRNEQMEELKRIISETIQKNLAYEIEIVGPSHGKQLEAIPLEERLASEIAMPVEEM